MKASVTGAVLVALVSLAASASESQVAPPPVFPSRTDVVVLDMVVRAKDGRLVQDLAADAFGAERAAARLAELAEAEARIVAELPLLPRIH